MSYINLLHQLYLEVLKSKGRILDQPQASHPKDIKTLSKNHLSRIIQAVVGERGLPPPKAKTPINAQAHVLQRTISPTGERNDVSTEGAKQLCCRNSQVPRTEGVVITRAREFVCFL